MDIGAPDYETRMAILQAKCDERGVRFRTGVIEEVGRVEFKNVRELQGALNRLIAFQTLGGEQIDAGPDVPAFSATWPSSVIRHRSRRRASGEFASFLTRHLVDGRAATSTSGRRGSPTASTYWRGEGYRTGALERVLQDSPPPASVEPLLREFEGVVSKLRDLERPAAAPGSTALAAHDAFQDPDRLSRRNSCSSVRCARRRPRRDRRRIYAPGSRSARAISSRCARPTRSSRRRAARYNPLFIHGPSGVGKTHLAQRDRQRLGRRDGGTWRRVCAGAVVRGRADRRAAGRDGRSLARALSRRRGALDDVQFVAGKERTQEELFHVFNALYAEGQAARLRQRSSAARADRS